MEDSARATPGRSRKLYIRSDNGQRLVPLGEFSHDKADAGSAGGKPPESIHEHDSVLNSSLE